MLSLQLFQTLSLPRDEERRRYGTQWAGEVNECKEKLN